MPTSLVMLSEWPPFDHISVPPGGRTYGREGHMEGRNTWNTLLELSFPRTCAVRFTENKSDPIVAVSNVNSTTPSLWLASA